jgi:hypothetical protein
MGVAEKDERDRLDMLEPGHYGTKDTGGMEWARAVIAKAEGR